MENWTMTAMAKEMEISSQKVETDAMATSVASVKSLMTGTKRDSTRTILVVAVAIQGEEEMTMATEEAEKACSKREVDLTEVAAVNHTKEDLALAMIIPTSNPRSNSWKHSLLKILPKR